MLAMMFATNVVSSNALSDPGDIQNQTKPNKLNLLIMVRAGTSINGSFFGNGKSKLAIIKDVMDSTVKGYAFPSNADIGIMTFGHLIDKSNVDASCAVGNVEMIAPFAPIENLNLGKFNEISGTGYSPTAIALQEAGKRFTESDSLNVILLIADGEDECYGDTLGNARKLIKEKNIRIYTIGLKVSSRVEAELVDIAGSPENYFNVPRAADTEEKYVKALDTQIRYVFDKLVGQISAPAITLTPLPIDTTVTPITEIVPTGTPPSVTPSKPQAITATPTFTSAPLIVDAPSQTWALSGILIVAVIGLIVVLIFGYVYWNSRLKDANTKIEKDAEIKAQIANGNKAGEITRDASSSDNSNINVNLDSFLQDIFNAYSSIGEKGRYIQLSSLKNKISNTYTERQFDELLMQARRKYPSKILIDKDSKLQTIIKISL